MERVPFVFKEGKTAMIKPKLANHLQRIGKGEVIVEPEQPAAAAGVAEDAAELGVDLSQIEGTGKDGKILKRDLKNYQTRMLKAD